MPATTLALLALAAGLVVGAGICAIVVFALRARERARTVASVEIPGGVHDVLQGMDDAAVVVDASLTVLAASAPAVAFGAAEGAVLGDDGLRALTRSVRRTGQVSTTTLRLTRLDSAETRLVSARASVISPRLTLIVVRDITEHERVEQMRRDFVANTSHEFKTPVQAVSLLAEAIDSAADDPDQVRRFSQRLGVEATRLAQLTDRVMSLSRLQSAGELADVGEVSIDEVVATACDAHTVAADAAGVRITRGGEKGHVVRGDVQILVDALGNLIANAIAHSPPGSAVGVGVRSGEGTVDIAVTDRGSGISEADQERVFERFYRADEARSRRTGGTGLGLSIVKHAVQRHGGTVTLWSRPGQGSTFTIRLPEESTP